MAQRRMTAEAIRFIELSNIMYVMIGSLARFSAHSRNLPSSSNDERTQQLPSAEAIFWPMTSFT